MHKFLIFYFLLTSIGFAATPRKIGLLLGGGKGEEDKLNEVFIQQGEGFSSNLIKKDYEIRGAFGGESFINEPGYISDDRDQSYKDAWKTGKFKTATVQSVEEQLDWILSEIANGKINKGDKVVIQLSTHGKDVDANTLAHSIFLPSTEEGKDLTYPLGNKLNTVLQKLNDVGAQTALLDFSCFSGGSLDLARNKSNVCAISSTNRYTPAYASGNGQDAGGFFWQTVQKADQGKASEKSLESIFLSSRRMNTHEDIPEISSEEHQKIRQIWDLLFAQYASESMGSDRVRHVAPILTCSEVGVTIPVGDYKIFEDLIRETMKSDKDIAELSVIAKRIKRLAEIRDEVNSYLDKKFGSFNIEDEEFNTISFSSCRDYYNKETGKVEPLELATEYSRNQIKEIKVSDYYYYQEYPSKRQEGIDNLEKKIKSITQKYAPCTTDELRAFISPKLVKHVKNEAEFFKLEQEQTDLQKKFKEKEREVYERIYKEFSKDVKGSNACRNFVL